MDQAGVIPHFLTSLRFEFSATDWAELPPLTTSEWEEYIRLAARQRVAPLLGRRLSALDVQAFVPLIVRERLERLYFTNAMRQQRLTRELSAMLKALRGAGVDVIVLKGAYLATAVYADPAQRVMTDVDLLVAPAQLTTAYECLRALGYDTAAPFVFEPYLSVKNHLPALRKPGAVAAVELHWNVTFPNQPWSLGADDLWARAITVEIAEAEALSLCPEDVLLYLCYHATYHHLFELFCHGISPVCDVDRVIRRFATELNWNALVERAVAWHWERGVHLLLSLAVELLRTPVPADVLQRLCPTGFNLPLLQRAVAHLLADKSAAQWVSTNLVEFWQEPHAGRKVVRLWRSLFPSPSEMAVRYSIATNSPTLLFFYLSRWGELMRRWGRKSWRLWQGEQEITALGSQQHIVAKWLEGR